MSTGLVVVLAVAAGVLLLLGLLPALRLPGALLEIVVGVLIGPSVLGWVTPHPAALAAVPGFLLALLVVRALPAVAFRRDLHRRELVAVGLLQATSLPFLLAAVEIGREMGMLDPAVGAGLVAAGLVSVLIFPAAALTLLPRPAPVSSVTGAGCSGLQEDCQGLDPDPGMGAVTGLPGPSRAGA